MNLELILMMVANGHPISPTQAAWLREQAAADQIVEALVSNAARSGRCVIEQQKREHAEMAACGRRFLDRLGIDRGAAVG